jgi:hypothetical protein
VVSGNQPLQGIGATAFWVGFEKSGGPDTVRGVLWESGDGNMRNSLGNPVGSAHVSLAGEDNLIYRDPDLDTIGMVGSGGGRYSFRLSDFAPADLLDGGLGRKADDGTWTWTQFGALPPGSHEIKLELAPGDSSWASAVMSDGWVAVLAVNHVKSEHAEVVTSVSYTDAAGTQVRYPK